MYLNPTLTAIITRMNQKLNLLRRGYSFYFFFILRTLKLFGLFSFTLFELTCTIVKASATWIKSSACMREKYYRKEYSVNKLIRRLRIIFASHCRHPYFVVNGFEMLIIRHFYSSLNFFFKKKTIFKSYISVVD